MRTLLQGRPLLTGWLLVAMARLVAATDAVLFLVLPFLSSPLEPLNLNSYGRLLRQPTVSPTSLPTLAPSHELIMDTHRYRQGELHVHFSSFYVARLICISVGIVVSSLILIAYYGYQLPESKGIRYGVWVERKAPSSKSDEEEEVEGEEEEQKYDTTSLLSHAEPMTTEIEESKETREIELARLRNRASRGDSPDSPIRPAPASGMV